MEWYTKVGAGIIVVILCFSLMRGCSEQSIARSYGGETDVPLEPNQKLIEITWKDDSLWYLTRDMKEDEEAEDYTFQEKDPLGMWEGTVHIHEIKMNAEEYQEYLDSLKYQEDYYKLGNSIYDENTGEYKEVYIHCDYETGMYELIKPYKVDENTGELLPAN